MKVWMIERRKVGSGGVWKPWGFEETKSRATKLAKQMTSDSYHVIAYRVKRYQRTEAA